LPSCLRLDLGLIRISSKTWPTCGRWKKQAAREVYVNSLLIDAKSVRIDYLSHSSTSQVMPPFDLKIDYETINSSPLLVDGHLSPGIDFDDLQIQEKIAIRTFETSLDVKFKPAVYTYLMRCLDLNINYVDELEAFFQFYDWNSSNAMKQYHLWKQIVQQFRGTTLKRRELKFELPCLSLKCLNESGSLSKERDLLLAELLLCGTEMELEQYLDTRCRF